MHLLFSNNWPQSWILKVNQNKNPNFFSMALQNQTFVEGVVINKPSFFIEKTIPFRKLEC